MKIGILSDTHQSFLEPWIFQAFSGVDLILHAGDVIRDGVLIELETIAPVQAVRGNCDPWDIALPMSRTLRFGRRSAILIHQLEDADNLIRLDTFLVIYGHTHVPRMESVAGIWMVNPGSPVSPRGGHPPSVLVLTIEDSGNEPTIKGIFKFPGERADG